VKTLRAVKSHLFKFNLDYGSNQSFATVNGGNGPEQFSSLTIAQLAVGSKISFDDGGRGNDLDFEDFSVNAQLAPEPVTVFGTILGIGALGVARSKKKRSQQPEK
jgi:hypothetical protein